MLSYLSDSCSIIYVLPLQSEFMHIAIISRAGKLSASSNIPFLNITSTVSNSPVQRENMSHTLQREISQILLPNLLPQRNDTKLYHPVPIMKPVRRNSFLLWKYPRIIQRPNHNIRFVIFVQEQTVRRYVTVQALVFAPGCRGEKKPHSTDDDRKYSFEIHDTNITGKYIRCTCYHIYPVHAPLYMYFHSNRSSCTSQ